MTNLFVGACLLIGALSSGVPPMPTQSVPNLMQMPENDPTGFDDNLVEFHMQAGLVDKLGYCSALELVRIVVRNRGVIRRCP